MRIARLLIFVASLVATPAFADRPTLLASLCAAALAEQIEAISAIAQAGASGGYEEARWAQTVIAAVEGRSLRCSPVGVFIGEGVDALEAIDLAAAETPTGASALPVNNRLRATAASAAAVLSLFSETDPTARAKAATTLERRREALSLAILDAALAAEEDATVASTLDALRTRMMLDDPDAEKRIRAIEAISAVGSLRNRTLIAEALTVETDPFVIESGEAAIKEIDRELAVGRALSTLYSGLSYASVLLLAALGLAIIFGLMGVINLAQGEFIMIGAYAAWFVQNAIRVAAPGLLEWYLIIAMPVSFLAAAIVGIAMEALVLRRLYDRPLMTLLATWAVSLLLINLVRVTIGTQNLEFYQPFYVTGGIPMMGDFIITLNRLFAIAIAIAAFIGVVALLRFSTFGMNVRAVAQNRAMASAAGIDARRTDRLAIALGSGLAGLAGVALAPLYNVNPNMGAGFIVDSFMVVVLGGVGSLLGTVVASLGIGQINVMIEPIYGAVTAKVVVLLLVIAFIQRRPEGLFAQKGRR